MKLNVSFFAPQYSFFLILLVIAQIVIAILVFVFIGDVKIAIQKGFERIFNERDNKLNADLIDTIQSSVSCCGTRIEMIGCCNATKVPTGLTFRHRVCFDFV